MGADRTLKRSFLCVDDYGQGGIWYVVLAKSPEQIKERLPLLTVVENRPSWLDDAEYKRIEEGGTIDIDNLPTEGTLGLAVAELRGELPPISNEEAAKLINAELEKLRSRKG